MYVQNVTQIRLLNLVTPFLILFRFCKMTSNDSDDAATFMGTIAPDIWLMYVELQHQIRSCDIPMDENGNQSRRCLPIKPTSVMEDEIVASHHI